MTGTSAQPSQKKGGWWVSPQPLLLTHMLINNHTESLPWPEGEKKERKEPFRQLLSSHGFQLTFLQGSISATITLGSNPCTPLSPLNDTNLNHPGTVAEWREAT